MSHGQRRSKFLVRNASESDLVAAMASDVDTICVDIEDTVEDKVAARKLAETLPSRNMRAEASVRINPLTTKEGLADLLWLSGWAKRPSLIVMAKVVDPHEIRIAAEMLPGAELCAIIETPEALEAAADIGRASHALHALMLGGKDLSMALGCARSWDGLLYARGRLVHAAALAGVEAHDEPYRPLEDLEGLAVCCRKAREMGFAGKATVDLRHAGIINEAFSDK